MYYVYVIQNENNELYIGYTHDLKRRLEEHNTGKSTYTSHHSWELVYYEAYRSKADATQREAKLKQRGQSKRWLKERIAHSIVETGRQS